MIRPLLPVVLVLLPVAAPGRRPAPDLLAWALPRLAAVDPVERIAAQRTLATLGSRAHPGLVAALRSPRWSVREGALLALAWGRVTPPREPLEALAGDPSWPVRRALLLVWGWHGLGTRLPRRLLADTFHDVRATALLALAAQSAPTTAEIGAALADRSLRVRRAAGLALVGGASQPPLATLPGAPGDRPRRRALRALAARPDPGQVALLRRLIGAPGAPLGERLLALQVVRPLGSRHSGDAGLVLTGLADPRASVRGVAMEVGRLLTTSELESILLPALLHPAADSVAAFRTVLSGRERSLGPPLGRWLDRIVELHRLRYRLTATGLLFLPESAMLVAARKREGVRRLGDLLELARRAGVADLAGWLLRRARAEPDPLYRNGFTAALVSHAGVPAVQRHLVGTLGGLDPRGRIHVVKAIIKAAPADPPPVLLLPLERGRLDNPRERENYLRALAEYPPTPRFRALLRRLLREDDATRVRDRALRRLVREGGPLAPEVREDLAWMAGQAEISFSLRRLCLEELAQAGAWKRVEGILGSFGEGRRLDLQVALARLARRRELRSAVPTLRRWAATGPASTLAGAAHLALAWLGEEASYRTLVELSGSMGESMAGRVGRVFQRAPRALAKGLFTRWVRPGQPPFFREEACLLAGRRQDLPVRAELERLGREEKDTIIRGAALRALVQREEVELPRSLLPGLLEAPPDSPAEEVLQEVLAGIRERRSPWAAPFFWRAILENRLRNPLAEVDRTRRPTRWSQRSGLEQVRLLADQLFSLEDKVVAQGLKDVLVAWRGTLGRGLLGKDVLQVLLEGTVRSGRRPPKPITARYLARLSLELPPRGRPIDLSARIILAEDYERRRRWKRAADLYREARRVILLGGINFRQVEYLLGENQPARGRFPLTRLAVRPLLLEARQALESGRAEQARTLLRRVLERGRADLPVTREARALSGGESGGR